MLFGWFAYIPTVVAPIAGVSILLFNLRKMTTRAINIMNLVLAMGTVLLTITAMSSRLWADLPPPKPNHSTSVLELVTVLIVFIWISGAVGLFFRKRLAWIGSVIGVGASISVIAAGLLVAIAVYFYPGDAGTRAKEFGTAGYTFAFAFMITMCSLPLAVCLRLLLGLFQVRREIFATS